MNSCGTFTWDDSVIKNLVWTAAKDVRVVRPLLTLYGKQGDYLTNIVGHQVDSGPPLSISINQNLTPVKLSCEFKVRQEQRKDEDTLKTLAVEAAYRVAAAEEAVILLGSGAESFLSSLNVDAENLAVQTGLFPATPTPVAETETILDSIVQGINELQSNGRFRKYAAIVSLDLHQQAYKPRKNAFDAQIYEIRPLLVEGGFLYSQAAPKGTGVIFSLSGDSLKIAVPVDTCVECVKEETDVTLQVVEQIRLLVDVPKAVVPLR